MQSILSNMAQILHECHQQIRLERSDRISKVHTGREPY